MVATLVFPCAITARSATLNFLTLDKWSFGNPVVRAQSVGDFVQISKVMISYAISVDLCHTACYQHEA